VGSCEELRGRWDDARKEVGRRIALRKDGKGKRRSCKEVIVKDKTCEEGRGREISKEGRMKESCEKGKGKRRL
jgi:hypothetical protein